MLERHFRSVWDALSPDLRSQLVRHPGRPLEAEHVDELVAAGGREVHALWFDSGPGRRRQWATTWQFRRFVENHTDGAEVVPPAAHRSGIGGRARGLRLPMMPG